jgi:transcriptional regulator with XRE-family HTH domain
MVNWGFTVKKIREEKNLTQDELAQKSGIDRSHIGRIELGHYQSFKEVTITKLARGLDMTVPELTTRIFGGEAKPSIKEVASALLELADSELVRVPKRGIVPAGHPLGRGGLTVATGTVRP